MAFLPKPSLTKEEVSMDSKQGKMSSADNSAPAPDEMRDAMERRALIANQVQGPHKNGMPSMNEVKR